MRAGPLLLAGLLALALTVASCGGGSTSGPLPEISGAHAERIISADGQATLASTITVEFDRPVKPQPGSLPLASYFELSMVGASGPNSRVLVQKASADSARKVTLNIEAVIADGSTLKVAKRLFQPGAQGNIEAPVSSELNTAQVVLATTALAITDPRLLDNPAVPEVKPADRDTAAQREALQAHLEKRGESEKVVAAALARFDSISATVVPSPKARAAIAALTGTFAQPAIDALLTGANCTKKPAAQIVFQPPPDAPKLLARVTYTPDGARIISLNPVLEGDRIEHIMPLIAHEAIHCDQEDTLNEEVAATAFDTFLYVQLIAADPTVITTGSPAAKEMNVDAVAFINSGARVPESVGLLPSAGVTKALPNTNSPYGSFAELAAEAYPNVPPGASAPEALAQAYVAGLASQTGMPVQNAFSLRYLDELLGRAMHPHTLAQAIIALQLEPE